MPAFPLPDEQLSPLTEYIRSLNATAFESRPPGDKAAGESFFFGAGNCATCHTVAGRGGSNGPDLSGIARQLTLPELEQSLTDPSARIATGYGVVDITLNGGKSLRGFARSRAATICSSRPSTARCTSLPTRTIRRSRPNRDR